MTSVDLDKLDNPPPPPRYLYKYLSTERVGSVLEAGTVRFTPLLDTNDIFEVRSTFDKIVGPKMLTMLSEQMDNILSEDSIRKLAADTLKENGLSWFPPDLLLKILEEYYGGNFMGIFCSRIQDMVDKTLIPHFNDPETTRKVIEDLGQDLLCFSLSERLDSPPMWAHYADNNAGFVVAFDTEHAWFRQRKNGKRIRLQKVSYFDGKLVELSENPRVALISKTTDWAYEREWRIYIKNGEADFTVGSAEAPIQLLEFPPDVVNRVILGVKMHQEVANRIRKVVANHYPHAVVMRAVPNRESHTYDELPE